MWHLVAGAVAVLIAAVSGLGWLVLEGPESRSYGRVALVSAVATYWLIPWDQLRSLLL